MTQNPYQYPAPQPGSYPQPQSYPAPQPGQYPPAPGYPSVQPEQPNYLQQPPSVNPNPFTQPGQAGPPAGEDPFGNPAPPRGSGDQPALHQLSNRLLLIRPTSYNPVGQKPHPSNPASGPTPLVVAEMVICDGEPIAGNINGETEQFTPFASGPKAPPFYCGSIYVSGAVLPGQLEDYVAGRGFCLGRLTKGTPSGKGKPPWILTDPSEQDKVLGRQIHAQWEQLKAASAPVRPDQFGAPQTAQPYQPAGYGPPPGYQQPPAGYPGQQAQNPYGAPPQAPMYPTH